MLRKLVLLINAVALALVCFYYYQYLITPETGAYAYPLDDTYIHLSIAKNLATNGTWGVTSHEFSSTSSSPVYTLLLSALIKVFGDSTIYPLLLNVFLGLIFVYLVHLIYRDTPIRPYLLNVTLIIWLPLIYVQVLTGMEHMLHIVFSILTLGAYQRYVSQKDQKSFYLVCLVSVISSLVRYESLFLIFPICVILLLQREYFKGFGLGILSLVPITVFGFISVSHGADFFPNSLLIKGNVDADSFLSFIKQPFININNNRYLVPVLAGNLYILLVSFRRNEGKWSYLLENNYLQIILLITVAFHASFASFGWLYRYDAYIKVVSVISLAPLVAFLFEGKFLSFNRLVAAGLIAMLVSTSINPAKRSFRRMRFASINIYQQHVQMATFIHHYYNHSKVVANDIGAISYFSDIHLLDLIGLGNDKVQQIRRVNKIMEAEVPTHPKITPLMDNFEIALIYDKWFAEIPENFIKVGEWTIQNNVICGDSTVSFYAIGEENVSALNQALSEFSDRDLLDSDVRARLFEQNK